MRLQRAVRSAGGPTAWPLKLVPTTAPEPPPNIARAAIERGADLILVAGGDGTINEVVNGMVHSPVPLGIFPGGTANVLANELRIGNTMSQAAESLAGCTARRVALGLISADSAETPRYFLLMAGAGLDAQIVYRFEFGLEGSAGEDGLLDRRISQAGRGSPGVYGETSRAASSAPVSRWSAGCATTGAILKSHRPFRFWKTNLRWCCLKARISLRYLKYMLGAVLDA